MKAYIYQAAFLCETCAHHKRAAILNAMPDFAAHVPEDSDRYPQGPYANGGGEADTPQHCDACGVFLENPLTPDGVTYLQEKVAAFESGEGGRAEVIHEWIAFYGTLAYSAEPEE
jgi:hypothetical protein